jgi:hypothetical protein
MALGSKGELSVMDDFHLTMPNNLNPFPPAINATPILPSPTTIKRLQKTL